MRCACVRLFVKYAEFLLPQVIHTHIHAWPNMNMNMNFKPKRTRYRCMVCDEVSASACTCINIYGSEIKYWHTYFYTYMCINITLKIALISIGFLLHSFFLSLSLHYHDNRSFVRLLEFCYFLSNCYAGSFVVCVCVLFLLRTILWNFAQFIYIVTVVDGSFTLLFRLY